MYLLDTVIISELRKRQPAPAVVQWLSQRVESELFLSVLTIGEIQRGIAGKRLDDPAFADALSSWLSENKILVLPSLSGKFELFLTMF
jgi:predicted nucleic acid-binding protein